MTSYETKMKRQGGECSDRVEGNDGSLMNNKEKKHDDNIKNGEEESNMILISSTRPSTMRPTKQEVDLASAKWCRVLSDGRCQWDHTKLKCFLSEDERNDPLLVRNLVHGMIVSAQLYPLIFETSLEEDSKMVRLRSLSFFDQLLDEAGNGISGYRSLDIEQKVIVAIGVRDLFLGAWHGLLNERERRILNGMVDMLDETIGCVRSMGMNLSFHPSANFKVVKFIEALDDEVGIEWASLFAQVMHTPKLFAVFVDPVELSFHNFENIIPLDRWIEWKLEDEHTNGLSMSLSHARRVETDRDVVTCKLRGAACQLLKQLSSLDLYATPLNRATRGGERFIFHSALLSKALTQAVRSSTVLCKLSYVERTSSFKFVNYVFRCNRFSPEDAMFDSHLDTQYYDSARSEVSKYTLLIYLTTGHNKPTLRVSDIELDEIEEMTCVIFDQSYEHEAKPFLEGKKIFLRTELVFEEEELGHNTQIASLFSEACYMTGQSVFDDGLSSYAHECFERANSLHWAIERKITQPPAHLLKQFREMHFLTNGYGYWFANSGGVSPEDCGIVAVLDYFNCKIDGQPFRSLCPTTTIRERFDKTEDIWTRLSSVKKEKFEAFRRLKKTDLESLMTKCPEVNDSSCCPGHRRSTFNAWECEDVQKSYRWCCDDMYQELFGVPFLMFNQEIAINESNLKIVGDKMFFLRESDGKPLPRINFAACWGLDVVGPDDFVKISQKIGAPRLLIPPIMWHKSDRGYHLELDFFRNDWMVQVRDETIDVPTISNDVEID